MGRIEKTKIEIIKYLKKWHIRSEKFRKPEETKEGHIIKPQHLNWQPARQPVLSMFTTVPTMLTATFTTKVSW
jgi:hypothetical protein